MRATKLFTSFFESEKTGGILLLFCAIFSILVSNSAIGKGYIHLWEINLGGMSLEHIVNDGLMTIFFLMIGLELEREIYIGELSSIKNASLPIIAAVGGMILPAIVYFLLTRNTEYEGGFGVPMATDIAFAVGILSLIGKKVPVSLKIFLTALAVIDDLGAILIIGLFYSKNIDWLNLGLAGGVFAILLLLNRLKYYKLGPYLILGVVMWYYMLNSGVHATITGVLVAFAIPFENGERKSISYKLEKALHAPVAFIILPLFALVNTAIPLNFSSGSFFTSPYSLGIILGLIVGKPLGIFLFSFTAIKLKISKLAEDLTPKVIFGAGLLGGIGFTMSIFIALLAFETPVVINAAKIAIIIGSIFSGSVGYLFLKNYFTNKDSTAF